MSARCLHCERDTVLVDGSTIYPHRTDLFSLKFWLCRPCQAYVGCHRGTIKPLGTAANSEVRSLRKACHSLFDQIWKRQLTDRYTAYGWLCKRMNFERDKCHIGMFTKEQCLAMLDIMYNQEDFDI